LKICGQFEGGVGEPARYQEPVRGFGGKRCQMRPRSGGIATLLPAGFERKMVSGKLMQYLQRVDSLGRG
jgi:hypothetical protein